MVSGRSQPLFYDTVFMPGQKDNEASNMLSSIKLTACGAVPVDL